jgi:DNA-binding NarL/FixJ family response regulator
VRTVANQAAALFRKLKVGSRVELASVIAREGSGT